jgi:hypothetical protein
MSDQPDIKFVGDIQRVQVKPGDVFVISSPGPVSADQVAYLRAYAERALDGAKVLILCDGLKIGVLGSE